MKRWPIKCENIFANYVPDQGLIYKMYKESIQINSNKTTKNPTTMAVKSQINQLKWAKNLNGYFSKKTFKWTTGISKATQYH